MAEDKRDSLHYLAEYLNQLTRLATLLVSNLPKNLSFPRIQTQEPNLASRARGWLRALWEEALPQDKAVI
jgi:hypothetical protein